MSQAELGKPTPPGTFGGLFLARPLGPGFDEDRQFIIDEGFTIVDEQKRAGETRIFVFGESDIVGINLGRLSNDDPFNRFELPSFFFLLTEGEILTETIIRQWTDRNSVAFL